jgi:hypothetical protein
MGAQLQPEQTLNQDGSQGQHTADNQQPPATTSQQRDPLSELILQSQQEENQRLRAELERLRKGQEKIDNAPVPLPRPAKEMLFEDPDKLIGHIVDERMKKIEAMLTPILQNNSRQQRDREVDHWMNLAKNTPQLAAVYSHIEADLRNLLRETQGEITQQTVFAAINVAVGNLALRNNFQMPGATQQQPAGNQPPAPVNNNPTNPPVPPTNLPAHLRPSGNNAGTAGPRKPVINLSENELRMARENGLTPEEYVELQGLAPQEVINYGVKK